MAERKKIGVICSTFDLLHTGHVALIEQAASECDELWVCLQTSIPDRPEKNQPVQTVYERWRQLNALRDVRIIIPYESERDLLNVLATIPNHTRYVGSEYKGLPITGKHLADEVIYVPRHHEYSSSELRKRVAEAEKNKKNG